MRRTLSNLGAVLLLLAGLTAGPLLLFGRGVLVYEEQDPYGFVEFKCTYFTGLRRVQLISVHPTGCKRFILIGE